MGERISTELIRVWLKGRDRRNLRICSDPHTLTLGLADVSTAEHVHFPIKELREDRKLYKIYSNAAKQPTPEGMILGWLSAVSQD